MEDQVEALEERVALLERKISRLVDELQNAVRAISGKEDYAVDVEDDY